jgi:hypothetical protein
MAEETGQTDGGCGATAVNGYHGFRLGFGLGWAVFRIKGLSAAVSTTGVRAVCAHSLFIQYIDGADIVRRQGGGPGANRERFRCRRRGPPVLPEHRRSAALPPPAVAVIERVAAMERSS